MSIEMKNNSASFEMNNKSVLLKQVAMTDNSGVNYSCLTHTVINIRGNRARSRKTDRGRERALAPRKMWI